VIAGLSIPKINTCNRFSFVILFTTRFYSSRKVFGPAAENVNEHTEIGIEEEK
jgi:hypothetical protein